MPPVSMRKEVSLPATLSYPGLHRGDESWGLGPWAPSDFRGKSEEAEQSWVRGLLLRTKRGMSASLEGDLGNRPSNVPLCHSWGMDLEGALALGMSGPSGLLCRV